jgi:uncharacterized OsmC-like protein
MKDNTRTAAAPEQEKIVNGMSVTKLGETIQAIKKNPDIAAFQFRLTNRWQNCGQNEARMNSYDGACQTINRKKDFVCTLDEPPVLLGNDRGPNPVEYLLAALSGCMTTTLAYHAAAQGIKIESIQSEYEGDLDLHGFLGLDPKVRQGYQEVRVKFKVKGDADQAKVEELVRKSPVFDMLTNPVPVKIIVEIE